MLKKAQLNGLHYICLKEREERDRGRERECSNGHLTRKGEIKIQRPAIKNVPKNSW